MNDFIKKSVLLGVGAYSKAQKELEKITKSLIKGNKITREEGEHMLNKFLLNSKKVGEKIESQVSRGVSSFVKRSS